MLSVHPFIQPFSFLISRVPTVQSTLRDSLIVTSVFVSNVALVVFVSKVIPPTAIASVFLNLLRPAVFYYLGGNLYSCFRHLPLLRYFR